MKSSMRNMTMKEVEILSHETRYQGYFRIEGYQLRFKLFQGGWSNVVDREVFERGVVAALLPYDPVHKKVILVEQFRVGAMKDERSPWLLEVIAGVMNKGEAPEQVVHREAKEEANLEILELLPMYQYWVSPGGCSEHVTLFCGRIDSTKAGGIFGMQEENENIRAHVVDIEEAFQLVREGMITNVLAIVALQWLELNHRNIF